MIVTATELWRMGARELAAAIGSKRVSSEEVVEAYLRRIEAVNSTVNAVTVVLGDAALDAAKAADRAIAEGDDLGPLHGVPFTVKENIDLAGTATTQGVPALASAVPEIDAPQVERVRAAGAIPIGRTNLPDFGIRLHTDNALYGATVNPWDRSRTPGGSSGGEAVALATGMTALGLGNDFGGSLRWPAQCCGISALKPTLGRIPQATTLEPVDVPLSVQLMLVQGPMARRVADLRAAFAVMVGPSWRDPWSVAAPLRGPDPAKPIRVAVVVDPAGQGTAPQVADGIRKAARALDDAGYAVDEVEPPSTELAAKTWLDIIKSDLGAAWQTIAPPFTADTTSFLIALFALSPQPDPAAAVQAFINRQSVLRAWGKFQERYPLILAPVSTDPPFETGKDVTTDGVAEIIRGLRMTLAVNALGLPALALPVSIAEGLPQVVQLIGARYREDLCLDAAEACEQRVGVITPIDPR